jgi:hypothetical protein
MNLRISGLVAIAAFALAGVLGGAQSLSRWRVPAADRGGSLRVSGPAPQFARCRRAYSRVRAAGKSRGSEAGFFL